LYIPVVLDMCEFKRCRASGSGGVVWGELYEIDLFKNGMEMKNCRIEGCVAGSSHAVYLRAPLPNNQNFKFINIELVYDDVQETIFYLSIPTLEGIANKDEMIEPETFSLFKSKFEGWCEKGEETHYNTTHFIVHDDSSGDEKPLTDLICGSLCEFFFFFSFFLFCYFY
jgi:hypothetical protein